MAGFFPLSGKEVVHRRTRRMSLRTQYGVVELEVLHGQDPGDQHWGSPIRERWGLSQHRQLSFGFEEKLAFTVTATGSYREAAEVAERWGAPVSPSLVHSVVQRLGRKAEHKTKLRLKQPPREDGPRRSPAPLGVLMLDGWQVRQRGPGWGKQKTKEKRVEWHEWKTGVYYRQDPCQGGNGQRGRIVDKAVVGWQGDPTEFGQRLHYEAIRKGLARAEMLQVLGDGAPWIWNLASARWSGAYQTLDFYHGAQHLWEIGRTVNGGDDVTVEEWVAPRRHKLRQGPEKAVLDEIAQLSVSGRTRRASLKREQAYFATNAKRMDYAKTHRRGWPIGSGAVESTCRQRQCRFKRPGQFWSQIGMRNLGSIVEARHNHHWDELWFPS